MRTLDFRPVAEETYSIHESTPDRLAGEMWLGKGNPGPPIHIHPELTEHLKLLEGKLEIYRDGAWSVIEKGYEWQVPAGVSHTFRATADSDALVWFSVEPAGGFLGFLEDSHALIESGKLKSYESLSGLIYSSMIVRKYADDFVASRRSMRLVMAIAGTMGRLLGKRV